jgi:adenosylcobinamide-phosphate guanylyltransferase
MAGGRATRMGGSVEKPMLEVYGKSMLERVVEVLKWSSAIDRIIVAATSRTPVTILKAQELGVETIVTPGGGFEEDMRFAIRKLSLGDVMVISADLPFITLDIIERAVEHYRSSAKPSLAVMTKLEEYEKVGGIPQHAFKVNGEDLVAVGVNIIDGRRIGEGELAQTVLVVESSDVVLNVNTVQELEHARGGLRSAGDAKGTQTNDNQKTNPRSAPKTFQLARIAAFSALSVVGSFIHLPSPIPTVAFDSTPGFFAALYFGPLDGFCVFGVGHLATAVINGFPLGFLHLPIALGLAIAGATIGWINARWNFIPAVCTGVAINTALVLLAIPVLGLAATLSFTPFLFLASTVNGTLAALVYLAVRRRLKV